MYILQLSLYLKDYKHSLNLIYFLNYDFFILIKNYLIIILIKLLLYHKYFDLYELVKIYFLHLKLIHFILKSLANITTVKFHKNKEYCLQ